jgi:hypothetical protein
MLISSVLIQFRSLEKGLFKDDVNPSPGSMFTFTLIKTPFSDLDLTLWTCCCDSIVPQWLEGHGSPISHILSGAAFSSGARGRRHIQDFR